MKNFKNVSLMKNLRYIFALALIIMSGNILAANPTKCTSTDDLKAGSTYYISAASSYESTTTVMAKNTGGNNFPQTTFDASPVALTLGGDATNGWTFSYYDETDSKTYYLDPTNTTSNNHLKRNELITDYSKFSISFNDGAAVITSKGKTSRNIVRYNSGSSCFSCYTSGNQAAVYLYKAAECKNKITITSGENETYGTFSLSLSGENICADDPITVNVTNIVAADGYVASAITTSASGTPSAIANGAGTVTDISASTTIGVTFVPKISATLTKSVLGTTSDMGFSGYFIGDQVSLPGCDVVKKDYVFYGWSETAFSESEYASQKIYKAGDMFTLTQATQTLYAVYAVQDGTPVVTFDQFRQNNTMTTCQFVIAAEDNNKFFAMKNNFTKSGSSIEAIEVTLTDGHLTEAAAADYVLTFEKQTTNDAFKIYNGSIYLRGKESGKTDLGGGDNDDSGTTWNLITGQSVVGSYRFKCENWSRVLAFNNSSNIFKNYSTTNFSYHDCEIIPVGSGYTYSKFATRFITYQDFAYKCTYDIIYTLGDGHTWIDGYEAPAFYDHNKNGEAIILPTGDNLADGQYFLGWYDNEDRTGEAVTELAVTGNGEKTFYADWISKLTMDKTIALTSAEGATVGSATFTLSSQNLGNITTLRFSYKDVDNNIIYSGTSGETPRNKSEFRLCNESYTIDENNVPISIPFSKTYTITYKPNSANKMSHYQLIVELMVNNKAVTTQEFDLFGRSLPEQFVIATQKDDKWYALPADMANSGTYQGVEINVEGTGTEMVAYAPENVSYSLKTYNDDKTHVLFQSNFNSGHLWASISDNTGIKNNAISVSGDKPEYAWLLTSENEMLSYTICNKQDKPDHQYLGIYGSNMGMYKLNTPTQFYFLPVNNFVTIRENLYEGKIGTMCQAKEIVAVKGGTLYQPNYVSNNGTYLEFIEVELPVVEGLPLIYQADGTNDGKLAVMYGTGETYKAIEGDLTRGMVGYIGSEEDEKEIPNYCESSRNYVFQNNKLLRAKNNILTNDRAYINYDEAIKLIAVEEEPSAAPRRRLVMDVESRTTPTGWDDILNVNAERVQKLIINDKMYIFRAGKLYDATGKFVK